MTTLQFTSSINAPRNQVWEALWNDSSYRQWTSAFSEGSYAESDWNEGSKILFLSPEGSGMYSTIEKKIPNELMTFRHLGEIKNGVEDVRYDETASESYHLEDENGRTKLNVVLESTDDMAKYFKEIFPKALNILKQIAEQ